MITDQYSVQGLRLDGQSHQALAIIARPSTIVQSLPDSLPVVLGSVLAAATRPPAPRPPTIMIPRRGADFMRPVGKKIRIAARLHVEVPPRRVRVWGLYARSST